MTAPRITIPLDKAPEVIADSLRLGLKALGYELMQFRGTAGARVISDEDLAVFALDLGRNASQALMVLDETPIEEVEIELDPDVKPARALASGQKRKR